LPLEVFTQRNFVADFIRLKFTLFKNTKNRLCRPFGGLRGDVSTPSIARRKARGDFLFVIVELFRCLLRLRRYKQKSVEDGVFRRGWGTLSANFRGKGVAHQPLLVSEN